jgi:hypothetical protein
MDWLSQNWFWVVVFVLFFAMHLFGHGGHGGCGGGHGGHRPSDKDEQKPQTPADHQH